MARARAHLHMPAKAHLGADTRMHVSEFQHFLKHVRTKFEVTGITPSYHLLQPIHIIRH